MKPSSRILEIFWKIKETDKTKFSEEEKKFKAICTFLDEQYQLPINQAQYFKLSKKNCVNPNNLGDAKQEDPAISATEKLIVSTFENRKTLEEVLSVIPNPDDSLYGYDQSYTESQKDFVEAIKKLYETTK